MKWLYNLYENNDVWMSDHYETKEEAIKAANAELDDLEKYGGVRGNGFYVGQLQKYGPVVCIDSFIEKIKDQAYEECGEVSEDWLGNINETQTRLLENKLQTVLCGWLEEINEKPLFGDVINIEQVERKI
ncbi:TPA: hypothetical protein QCX62_003310 [Bacillus paranthracis]|nr:hypothetical protein [Bacillus paranthracis]